jgi:hypothetical protein
MPRSQLTPLEKGSSDQGPNYAGPAAEVLRLLDQIAAMRREHVSLEKLADTIAAKMQEKLNGQRERVHALRLAYFHDLGRLLRKMTWSRRQREQFIEVLIGFAEIMQEDHGDDLLEDLMRYTGLRREELVEESPNEEHDWEEIMHDFFGTPHFDGQNEAPGGERRSERVDEPEGRRSSKSRPKSGRSKRAEEPLKTAQKETSLLGDIRALYLMLARALHPDKESDAERRTEKTTWMQKVTAAYAAKNLGDLLDILVRNPLDAVGPYLADAPAKTLKSFAKRLRRELSGLREAKAAWASHYHPSILRMIRHGELSQQAYKTWENSLHDELKAFKDRARHYQTYEGAKALLDLAREHDLRALL